MQSGLSEDEIKKLVKEAELQAEADTEKADAASARNNLDNLVYQTEKAITEGGAKMPAAEVDPVKAELATAKKVLENKAAATPELKAAFEKLQSVSHKMTEAMYKNTGGAAPGGQPGGANGAGGEKAEGKTEGKDGDDVIDADFKDVN